MTSIDNIYQAIKESLSELSLEEMEQFLTSRGTTHPMYHLVAEEYNKQFNQFVDCKNIIP